MVVGQQKEEGRDVRVRKEETEEPRVGRGSRNIRGHAWNEAKQVSEKQRISLQ